MTDLAVIADDLVNLGRAWPHVEQSIKRYHARLRAAEYKRPQAMGALTRKIISDVAEKDGFGLLDLIQPSHLPGARKAGVCRARDEAICKVFELRKLNKCHIGRIFGGRDHSSIAGSIKRHRARRDAQ